MQPSARAWLLASYPLPVDAAETPPTIDAPVRITGIVAKVPTTTRHQCPNCGYVYDEAVGRAPKGFSSGTRWAQLPESGQCPQFAAREKPDFRALGDAPVRSDHSKSGRSTLNTQGRPRRSEAKP